MVLNCLSIENSGLVLLIVLLAASFQALLLLWQKKNPRSYLAFTFFGLWLIPLVISIVSGFVRFILFWLSFSALNGFILYKATRRPLSARTPRRVYLVYRRIFQVSFVLGILGYFLFLIWLFFSDSSSLASFSVLLMFYSVYAGVLSRDLIDLLSDKMASVIGVPFLTHQVVL